jgi:hypothetical protein
MTLEIFVGLFIWRDHAYLGVCFHRYVADRIAVAATEPVSRRWQFDVQMRAPTPRRAVVSLKFYELREADFRHPPAFSSN